MYRLFVSTCIFATFAISAQFAAADIMNPLGLSPGDQYRIAFVTGGIAGNNSDISVYNDFVTAQAALGSETSKLTTSWAVLGSTSGIDARTNTSTDPTPAGDTGVPIYLVDGTTRISDHYDDLWDGSLDNALNLDGSGNVPTGSFNGWTGTASDGTASANPMGGLIVGIGARSATDSTWIDFTFDGGTSSERRLYGLSGVLTVAAVPEPSNFIAILLVGTRFAFARRWRKA